MQRIFAYSLPAVLVLAVAASANAAVVITGNVVGAATSDPELTKFTIGVAGDAGEVLNSFAGINIEGGVHNVQPGFGQPSTHIGFWSSTNGDSRPEWAEFDTYLLFNPSDSAKVVGLIGAIQETNDNSNPAGLDIMGAVLAPMRGLGSFKFSAATDQITLTPAAAGANVQFLQVVIPTGTMAQLDVNVFDNQGNLTTFNDVIIGIPEPASAAMALLGSLALIGVRRRFA
jgi:hypothetical protein